MKLLAGMLAVAVSGCVGGSTDDIEIGAADLGSDLLAGAHPRVEARLVAAEESAFCETWELERVEFTVRYENRKLPWGTTVTLHRGEGGCHETYIGDGFGTTRECFDWRAIEDVEMPPVAPWTWEARTEFDRDAISTDALVLNFVIRIRLPDGREIWDTAGYDYGYYNAWVFSPRTNPCGPDSSPDERYAHPCNVHGACEIEPGIS
jgi:hypothetical protein